MLEATILKTNHRTKAEAEKLKPYILECDIFSPECTHPKDYARSVETSWQNLLKQPRGIAKRELRRTHKDLSAAYNFMDEEALAYHDSMFLALHDSKKPIWVVEKLPTKKEAEELVSESNAFRGILDPTMKCLLEKDIEGFLRLSKDYLMRQLAFVDKRDKIIAQEIDSGEPAIRKAYPHLEKQENLKLCVQIGATHRPEIYTARKVKVIDKVNLSKNPVLVLKRRVFGGLKEIPQDERLRWGLLLLWCKGLLNSTPEEIEKLDYEGLVKLATK